MRNYSPALNEMLELSLLSTKRNGASTKQSKATNSNENHFGQSVSVKPTDFLIQRKSSCACGGGCPNCQSESSKLPVSQPNDASEIEADDVANKVMRMSVSQDTKISNTKDNLLQRKRNDCGSKKSSVGTLAVGGEPLTDSVRSFFEPRFGWDFSQVRVHTDAQSAASAKQVNALAYTVGQNIVFNEGRYSPDTNAGQTLLAHELTHVIQQSKQKNTIQRKQQTLSDGITPASLSLQRACGGAEIGTPEGCTPAIGDIAGLRFLFRIECDEFAGDNDVDLRAVAGNIANGETVDIHGLSSIDGDSAFNSNLSCARALRAKEIIESVLARRGISATLRIFSHGAVAGNSTQMRSVVIVRTAPTPVPIPLPIPTPTPSPTPTPTPTPTFPSTPTDCTPSQARRSASGCTPNPHGNHLPDVGGTHTESHPFAPCLLTEADVSTRADWCVDRQQAHGGEVCYRQIPTTSGAPGDQYCYSENCCHNSSDVVSVVSPTSPGSGSCCETDRGSLPGHIWEDVLPEFWDDPCRVLRDTTGFEWCRDESRTAECLAGCENVNIFLRGFCIDGCLGLPPM